MYTIEEFDKQKSKVMNYILYKKRTEQEVKNKFSSIIEENMLEDILEYVKEAGYLSDNDYIERSINEYRNLKNLSIKEIKYKLTSKGIRRGELEDYVYEHIDELREYERQSASNIARKKKNTMTQEEIIEYLYKKGYTEESIRNLVMDE